MIAVFIIFGIALTLFWAGLVVDEGTFLFALSFVTLMISFIIMPSFMIEDTSDKGYNVWKSYTISGNDTTDVTWHVMEKK